MGDLDEIRTAAFMGQAMQFQSLDDAARRLPENKLPHCDDYFEKETFDCKCGKCPPSQKGCNCDDTLQEVFAKYVNCYKGMNDDANVQAYQKKLDAYVKFNTLYNYLLMNSGSGVLKYVN